MSKISPYEIEGCPTWILPNYPGLTAKQSDAWDEEMELDALEKNISILAERMAKMREKARSK